VPWVELFAALAVSHLAGDFVLQTEWQATNKQGGLGPDPVARRALVTHVVTYTLTFLPVLIWIGSELGGGDVAVATVLIAFPHLIQDDGRLISAYMHTVKKTDSDAHRTVAVMVDQSLHVIVLFGIALLIGS
jgi:hypothetical protein